jgi:hypothetical protein
MDMSVLRKAAIRVKLESVRKAAMDEAKIVEKSLIKSVGSHSLCAPCRFQSPIFIPFSSEESQESVLIQS